MIISRIPQKSSDWLIAPRLVTIVGVPPKDGLPPSTQHGAFPRAMRRRTAAGTAAQGAMRSSAGGIEPLSAHSSHYGRHRYHSDDSAAFPQIEGTNGILKH
jgi:hypothetical protein